MVNALQAVSGVFSYKPAIKAKNTKELQESLNTRKRTKQFIQARKTIEDRRNTAIGMAKLRPNIQTQQTPLKQTSIPKTIQTHNVGAQETIPTNKIPQKQVEQRSEHDHQIKLDDQKAMLNRLALHTNQSLKTASKISKTQNKRVDIHNEKTVDDKKTIGKILAKAPELLNANEKQSQTNNINISKRETPPIHNNRNKEIQIAANSIVATHGNLKQKVSPPPPLKK